MTCGYGDIGTTTRSAYARGNEHMKDLRSKNENSDFWNHCKQKHQQSAKNFQMDVIETFKGDATLRQISEAVRIERAKKETLINRKKEYRPTNSNLRQKGVWHQTQGRARDAVLTNGRVCGAPQIGP